MTLSRAQVQYLHLLTRGDIQRLAGSVENRTRSIACEVNAALSRAMLAAKLPAL